MAAIIESLVSHLLITQIPLISSLGGELSTRGQQVEKEKRVSDQRRTESCLLKQMELQTAGE